MKRIIVVIVYTILFHSSFAQLIDTFYRVGTDGKIQFTNKVYTSYIGSYDVVVPYLPVSSTRYKSQGNSYAVEFSNIKDCETDPGFARVIQLYCNGRKILEFIDMLGWCDLAAFSSYSSVATDDCLIFCQKNNVDVIVIEGYPYESQPRTLVIAVQGSQAKVVYFTLERKFHIESVRKDSDGYFEIRLEDDWVEEGPNGATVPKSYTMKATATGMYLYKD